MTFMCYTFTRFSGKKFRVILFVFCIFLITYDHIMFYDFKIKGNCQTQSIINKDVCEELQKSNENYNITQLPASQEVLKTREYVEREQRTSACTFYDPLINKSNPVFCATENFVSLVRSKCKTRLGNQLSAYAAIRYFEEKFNMVPILDPFQMNIINSVFEKSSLKVRSLDLNLCCPSVKRRKWKMLMAFATDRTGIATGYSSKFLKNPEYYSRNFLVGLGPHSNPLFLFKDILTQIRKELVFKANFAFLANKMLDQIISKEKGKELIFVGIHARRGDRIQVWKQRKMFRDSIVGLYEGKFFNHAMDIFRNRYNNEKQKVIFLPTSDDYFWIKKHLTNKDDVYFSREMIKESRAAKPTFKEIHRSWRKVKLASKGANSYGVDLAVLSRCNHSIVDYGTFGMWAALLAGGKIVLPLGYNAPQVRSPDMVWWDVAVEAGMDNVEYVDITALDDRAAQLVSSQ